MKFSCTAIALNKNKGFEFEKIKVILWIGPE
jgi:hypothetical protein